MTFPIATGVTPLGYEVRNRKLIINPSEAATVDLIYRRYMLLGSVRLLKMDLDSQGIRSKVRIYQDGTRAGGCRLSRGALYALLSNPIYVGEIGHKGARYPGQQEPILDRATWEAVQKQLRDWGSGRRGQTGKTLASPLMGKLFDAAGGRLTPSHALKDGRRYRYYVSRALVTGTSQETSGAWRLPALQIEKIVAAEAANMLADRGGLAAALEKIGLAASRLPAAIASAEALRRRLGSELEQADALAILIDRVELKREAIRTTLSLAPLILSVDGPEHLPPDLTLMCETPLRIKRRGVEMRLVIESLDPAASRVDPILLKEIARAQRYFEALVTGRARSLAELARREGLTDSYVSTRLPLAFLAPDVIEAIVNGTQPPDLTSKKLITRVDLPLDWHAQKRALGFR